MSRIDVIQLGSRGSVSTETLEDGALAATAAGRSKIADGFFTNRTLSKFATLTFPANLEARSKFGFGFTNTELLADGVLSADEAGRKKMGEGYFTSDTIEKFGAGAFPATTLGRSKFADELIDTNHMRQNVLSADTLGRSKMEAGYFDHPTVEDKFEDSSICPNKLCLAGEDWDFTGATSVQVPAPTLPDDAVTLQYFQDNVTASSGWRNYRVIDSVADAVPGMTNTYYIDKGATTHGYNVAPDANSTPEIYVTRNGRELLWVAEGDLGSPTISGDFTVVRSLSTGPEGSAAVGSLNAVTFDIPLEGVAWIRYRQESEASA